MTEKEKMIAGEIYDPYDAELLADRARARGVLRRLNANPVDTGTERAALTEELLGKASDLFLQAPFYCDYGYNIHVGRGVYFNFNCVVLDGMPVRIGDNVLFGPAVQIYTATHPLDAAERRSGVEFAKGVTIGSDVWVGGGAVLCPGVTIGARTVIGAGSVVTKDIPADVVAAGNPCRVLRLISQSI
jgi:maltose O-acetyltransferase